MEKVHTIFLTDKSIKVSGLMEKSKGLEYANGLMEKFMKGIGWIIGKTEQAFLSGLMVDNTKELIEMIKNMVKELIYGQTEGNTSGNGRMIKDTERENM